AMFVIPEARTAEQRADAGGAPFNAREVIERARQQAAEGSRTWRREWRRQQRQWRRYGWAPSPASPYGSMPALLTLLPLFGLVHLALFVTLCAMIVSLVNTGGILDWRLPDTVPLWAGVLILLVGYQIVVSPIRAAHRWAARPHAGTAPRITGRRGRRPGPPCSGSPSGTRSAGCSAWPSSCGSRRITCRRSASSCSESRPSRETSVSPCEASSRGRRSNVECCDERLARRAGSAQQNRALPVIAQALHLLPRGPFVERARGTDHRGAPGRHRARPRRLDLDVARQTGDQHQPHTGGNAEDQAEHARHGRLATIIAPSSLAREAVDPPGPAARRGVGAIRVGVRGVPGRQRARRVAVGTEAVRMPDLRGHAGRSRRPVGARETRHTPPVAAGPGQDVVLHRR